MTLHVLEEDWFPSPTHWESTREFNRLPHDDSLFGEGPADMVTEKDSKTARATVLSNLLAELVIGGMRLKEAGFFGSYDLVRALTVQIERQYHEFIDEDLEQPE